MLTITKRVVLTENVQKMKFEVESKRKEVTVRSICVLISVIISGMRNYGISNSSILLIPKNS